MCEQDSLANIKEWGFIGLSVVILFFYGVIVIRILTISSREVRHKNILYIAFGYMIYAVFSSLANISLG